MTRQVAANEVSTAPLVQSPGRRTWSALAGLLLALAGPVSYVAFLDQPFLRATGAAGFALLILGTLIGWMAATRDRRKWVRGAAIFNTLLLGLFAYGLFGLSALPESQSFAAMSSPPDFTLPDENNRPVKLSDTYSAGPVLLVFYRGFW